MHTAEVRIVCVDEGAAARLAAALSPDDGGSVGLDVAGATLVVTARGATRMGLLRTLDDVLGCIRATGME